MKKKYYYDCPIQALYMNKEFGVQFYISYKNDFSDKKLSFYVDIKNIYNVLIQLLGICNIYKIYVAPESEHIFEPKDGERLKEWKEWHGGGSDKNGSDIIYRDGKNFFMPKEEN